MSQAYEHVVVVGATAWGTTLAVHLARNSQPVTLLARNQAEAQELQSNRSHERRLPGVIFPERLQVTAEAGCVANAGLVCLVVPSKTLVANVEPLRGHLRPGTTLLSAVKGIELVTGRRMTEVIADVASGHPLAVLSGPNLSREVAAGLPGSTVIASKDADLKLLQAAFHSTSLRVYTSTDVIGVELGGALKNVIAIAAGMVDALGFGDNGKAALLTRGLAEMTRLGVAVGADPMTFQGLAGMGDLVASSFSPLARNRRLGEMVGRGMKLEQALAELGETAEGATTIAAALTLGARCNVALPITEGVHRVLYEGLHPLQAMEQLMAREAGAEH